MTGWRSWRRIAARTAGMRVYVENVACSNGHGPECRRYVRNGRCVKCVLSRKRLRKARAALLAPRLPSARVVARAGGEMFYVGKPCRKVGHAGLRWVSSGTCCDCQMGVGRGADDRNGDIRPKESRRKLTSEQLEQRRAKCRAYKARKRAAAGKHRRADIEWLKGRQGGRCAVCLQKIAKGAPWEVDHRVALSCGGTNDRSNLQILHRSCNRSKGTHDEIVYVQRVFGRLL